MDIYIVLYVLGGLAFALYVHRRLDTLGVGAYIWAFIIWPVWAILWLIGQLREREKDTKVKGVIGRPVLHWQLDDNKDEVEFVITLKQLRQVMGVSPDLTDEDFKANLMYSQHFVHTLHQLFGPR